MLTNGQKVFGLGLSKTGTSSLGDALNHLGIRTIHYPSDQTTLDELCAGQYRLTLMNEWQGAVDISVAPFYAQLDLAFPASKFILTVRDKESWLRSCERHWALMDEWLDNFPAIKRFQEFIGAVTYGVRKYNRERFSWAYDRHVAAVREYFADRPDDFLEIDICGGEGWERLCPFLGCEAPDIAFPRANEWMHLLIEAGNDVSRTIPAGERILLLDQQGFGSAFAPAHTVVPFLEKDGVYWGIPNDDLTAASELRRLMRQGIAYIAVGFPCFWWLDHYPAFAAALGNECDVLVDNSAVKIFRRKAGGTLDR